MNQPQIKITMHLVVPDDQGTVHPQLQRLDPENQRELIKEFSDLLKHDSYGFNFKAGEEGQPAIVIHFKWHGKTAGSAIWAEEDPQGNVTKTYAVTAIMLGIDLAEDQQALDYVQSLKPMKRINPQRFETVKKAKRPTAAQFFTDAASAHNSELTAFMELFMTAFLNQFAAALIP